MHVRWLILCVHLTGLRAAQRAGETLFLVGARVLLEEIAFLLVDGAKIALPGWVGIIQSLGGLR